MFGRGVVTNILGDAGSDLVFLPLTPRRLVDIRNARGLLVVGVAQDFDPNGTDLSAQGGSATGCGLADPDPAAWP